MKCERCNVNNATHHYKKSINGVVTEKFLCASCAAEENMPFKVFSVGFPQAAFPFSFGNAEPAPAEQIRCATCGTTLAEFNETAYLGCARCYEHMREYLEPVIKKLHGSVSHKGKSPKQKGQEPNNKATERARLVRALEHAIEEEKFEEAARIRDIIRDFDAEEGKK